MTRATTQALLPKLRDLRWSRRSFDPSRPLAFLHIPKSAGTSLVAAIQAACGAEFTLGFDRSLFGAFDAFDSLHPDVRAQIHLTPGEAPSASLLGHFSYATIKRRSATAQVITVLREPNLRLLSHWLYWRATPENVLASWGEWADQVRKSYQPFAAFLGDRSLAAQIDNITVRMLLWPDPRLPDDDFIDPKHDRALLAAAKRRLSRCAFVGVVEDAELPNELGAWLGRDLKLERLNESEAMPPSLRGSLAAEFTPNALELLHRRSALDFELWRVAARRPPADLEALRHAALLKTTARHALLLAGGANASETDSGSG